MPWHRRRSGYGSPRSLARSTEARGGTSSCRLPAGLAVTLALPEATVPVQRVGRTGKALGAEALPIYRRAASLDPDDPWTWLAIAWLARGRERADAVERAGRTAAASEDVRARIAASAVRGLFLEQDGRPADAERELASAVLLARAAEGPLGTVRRDEELATAQELLGAFHARSGNPSTARGALEEALRLRDARAGASPQDGHAATHALVAELQLGFALGDAEGAAHRREGLEATRSSPGRTPSRGRDAWKHTVRRLMEASDAVAMDVRTFSARNQGCLFELQSLLELVSPNSCCSWTRAPTSPTCAAS